MLNRIPVNIEYTRSPWYLGDEIEQCNVSYENGDTTKISVEKRQQCTNWGLAYTCRFRYNSVEWSNDDPNPRTFQGLDQNPCAELQSLYERSLRKAD